jgi:hypothetical protein
MIVRVPGLTKAGTTSAVLTSSVDHYTSLLELLDIPFPKNQMNDGQSYVPALRGKSYQRKPIFSTFYHNIPPTGNRPNISMRQGPYKLYKFYFDGNNMLHRYELYNIDKDISEQQDLSATLPKVVDRMVAQLNAYEKEAKLLQPRINAKYNGHTVGDWQGSDSTRISVRQKIMHLEGTGTPEIKTVMVPMVQNDTIVLKFEMKSTGNGNGVVTYTQRIGKETVREQSVFQPAHYKDWRTYEIRLPLRGMLTDLAIATSASAGSSSLRNMRLVSEEGYPIFDWILY